MNTHKIAHVKRNRVRELAAYLGAISSIIGLVLASPVLVCAAAPHELPLAPSFLAPALALLAPGLAAWRAWRPHEPSALSLTEGAALISLAWIIAIFAGSIPFVLILDLNLTQALFESTSGWTTTGLSVVDVTRAPSCILFLRSAIELAGGAGLAILMVSLMQGPAGPGLLAAEGRPDLLAPQVARSARIIIRLYLAYAVIGTVSLWAAGMTWFDAMNHAFAAVSTGGFSTQTASIGHWDSPLIEAITIALMLLGTTHFLTSYLIICGNFKELVQNAQIRLAAVLIPLSTAILFALLWTSLYPSLSKTLRVSLFEAISALSTTGFSTVSYTQWPPATWWLLILLMIIGGGAGSTAGGLKLARVYLLYRITAWEIICASLPSRSINRPSWRVDGELQFIDDKLIRQTVGYLSLYLAALAFGSLIITTYGFTIQEALFEMASCLSTVGLSSGVTSPTAPTGLLWTEIIGMLLGRLEFFVFLLGIWRLARGAYLLSNTNPTPR